MDFDGTKVRLEQPDHTILAVPIRGLSKADQEYVMRNQPGLKSRQRTRPDGGIDFYGRHVSFLKLFGQKEWGETSPGLVTGKKIYHASGVVVDRSSTPNHIYVADTGNNRFLGFKSYDSPTADIVFGQADASSGGANRDSNVGMYGNPGARRSASPHFPWAPTSPSSGCSSASTWTTRGTSMSPTPTTTACSCSALH